MAWSEGEESDANNSGLSLYRDFPMRLEDDAQYGVIDLDLYNPVQAQHEDNEADCKNNALSLFPDICPNYLTQLARQHNYRSGAVISTILDNQDKGENYPTKPGPEARSRKRKRSRSGESNGSSHHPIDESDDEGEDGDCNPASVRSIKLQIATSEYAVNKASPQYASLARTLISQDFPRVPQNTIRTLLLENQRSVFETYIMMDEKLRNQNNAEVPWKEKKSPTKINHQFTPNGLLTLDLSKYKTAERAALAEFTAARKVRAVRNAKVTAEAEELDNFHRAQIEGQTTDCGICFEECPLNRMVQCEGETMHWFCRNCLRSQAEAQIGMAKYEITCMSMDGCSAGFSRAQRALFLDRKLGIALDRIEQEAVLRMAGIENLETCPFCPYAAEYPPVEVDKEFRCDNPDCQQVSCRLCRRKTHIPKTCAEEDADRGLDARHMLEEAMSEALIRRCNKCLNPFVKLDGCNKIRCSKCGTLQCDVCRKTIKDYSHFNDLKRGGKDGQCPLFDESEGRHQAEISSAEAEMRKKVVKENPNVDEEALRISTSENAKLNGNTHKRAGFVADQPVPRALPMFPERLFTGVIPGGGLEDGEVYIEGHDFPPHRHQINLALNNPIVPGPAMPRAAPPNPAPHPNGRIDDILKAAEDIVQKAIKQPMMSFRVNGIASPNEIPMPAPRQRGLGTILNKVETLKKRKNVEARRVNNPFSPQPQHQDLPHLAQAMAGPMPPRMDYPYHPFPGVPHSLNGVAPLGNQGLPNAGHLERLPGDSIFNEIFMDPNDPFLRR